MTHEFPSGATQATAREAAGIPAPRRHAPKRTVPDDKFAVVVRQCQACGCSTAKPCGTRQWTCDYCGSDMTMRDVYATQWKHHDRYGSQA